MNEEKQVIYLEQGPLHMAVQVTESELTAMQQLRESEPQKWEGKELELLSEAKKSLKAK